MYLLRLKIVFVIKAGYLLARTHVNNRYVLKVVLTTFMPTRTFYRECEQPQRFRVKQI